MKMVDLKKRLLAKGLALSLLGDLVSGIFFGVGYLAIDHFNDWMDTQSAANPPAQTTGERGKVATHPQQSRAAAVTTTDRD
jgi:hypothetical protein